MEEFHGESYQQGYDAAFAEMYSVAGDVEHAEECGECRACGVVKTIIEDTVHQLVAWLEDDEFWVLSAIVELVRERREQAKKTGQ